MYHLGWTLSFTIIFEVSASNFLQASEGCHIGMGVGTLDGDLEELASKHI